MRRLFPIILLAVLACCICQEEFEHVDEVSLDTDPDPEIIGYNGSIGGEKYTKIFIDYNNTGESYPYKYLFFKGETMAVGYDSDLQVGLVWIDTNLDGVNELIMWVKDENGDGFYEVVLISPP